MEQLTHFLKRIQLVLGIAILLSNLVLVVAYWQLTTMLDWPEWQVAVALASASLLFAFCIAIPLGGFLLQPVKALWQVILHVSPSEQGVAAPDVDKLKIGRELVASLASQVYQMANVVKAADQTAAGPQVGQYGFVDVNLPLPLFVLDATETIQFANSAAAAYLGQAADDLKGKNVYMVLDMAFPSENTLDTWLKKAKDSSATATMSWERVRMNVIDNHPTRLFDLAAYYNKDNPNQQETMLVLFDHTKQYSQDEQAISFIALSVHELRTPLTLLRGYVEAFQEELAGKMSPQMNDFMEKMSASAEQLTAFVNNILNVARIDDDQLELHLQEEDWQHIIDSAIANLSLRAKVRGIVLEAHVAPDLPKVGVDRLSIHEVINNLVDNAIKYSGDSKVIVINAELNKEGQVETTVTDKGLGIGADILPKLFTKFYRDHRNRAQIGGTGLGLYLSKAIVTAHGGRVWVRSKQGEGSTFGFTLIPYQQLAEELKNGDNTDIVRGAHGWIKNHSLYRR
jgi:signal transduction histidine kinase